MKAWLILLESYQQQGRLGVERVVSITQSRTSGSKIRDMLLQLHMDTMGVDIETRLDFSKHRNRYLSWVSETKLRGYKIGHDPQLSARLVSDLKVTGYEHDRFMLSWDDLTDRNTGPVFHTTWP